MSVAQTVSGDKSLDSKGINYGNGSGRFSPSDSKSLANSDSSYVRFKVRFQMKKKKIVRLFTFNESL